MPSENDISIPIARLIFRCKCGMTIRGPVAFRHFRKCLFGACLVGAEPREIGIVENDEITAFLRKNQVRRLDDEAADDDPKCAICGYTRADDTRRRRFYIDDGAGILCARCLRKIGKRAGR